MFDISQGDKAAARGDQKDRRSFKAYAKFNQDKANPANSWGCRFSVFS